MIKSLRWRLQIWHAVVLTAVLLSFGGLIYHLHWQTQIQQIDADLNRRAELLLPHLRRMLMQQFRQASRPATFGGVRPSGRPFRAGPSSKSQRARPDRPPPPPSDRPPADRVPSGRPPFDRPTGPNQPTDPDQPTSTAQTRDGSRTPAETAPPSPPSSQPLPSPRSTQVSAREPSPEERLQLPDELQALFEGADGDSYYFLIWGREGHLLARSHQAPTVAYPNLKNPEDGLPARIVRSRRHVRETVLAQRFDINVLVGKWLTDDITAERRYGAWLFLLGSGVLVAGLLGGAWMSDRAIRPILTMTQTAQTISATNLDQRLSLNDTDTELGQLAEVLNEAFDRLQAAFEQQSQFTADASHELRTPLSVILAHTELALSRDRSAPEYRHTLETCQRASLRMKSLIEDLLMLARFDSGQPSLERTDFDLATVIRESRDLLQPLADARQISLSADVTSCRIHADRRRLAQVLTNLITNAIRYNRDGGRVSVTIDPQPEHLLIQVQDTGVGIPADQLPHIFDRFYRVDQARSRAEGGSGLGLSICKTIVQAHAGRIDVISTPGSGTTVTVTLPQPPTGN